MPWGITRTDRDCCTLLLLDLELPAVIIPSAQRFLGTVSLEAPVGQKTWIFQGFKINWKEIRQLNASTIEPLLLV